MDFSLQSHSNGSSLLWNDFDGILPMDREWSEQAGEILFIWRQAGVLLGRGGHNRTH